jgi:hypothetical protein
MTLIPSEGAALSNSLSGFMRSSSIKSRFAFGAFKYTRPALNSAIICPLSDSSWRLASVDRSFCRVSDMSDLLAFAFSIDGASSYIEPEFQRLSNLSLYGCGTDRRDCGVTIAVAVDEVASENDNGDGTCDGPVRATIRSEPFVKPFVQFFLVVPNDGAGAHIRSQYLVVVTENVLRPLVVPKPTRPSSRIPNSR